MFSVNILAVVVSGIVAFIIGFAFHGPLFGKLWMRLANIHPTGNEKFSDMYGKMAWNVVTNLVTAYALGIIINIAVSSSLLGTATVWTGVICALVVWLGFLVTSSSIEVIWMGRAFKLWLFECVSSLVVMVVMGIILVSMR